MSFNYRATCSCCLASFFFQTSDKFPNVKPYGLVVASRIRLCCTRRTVLRARKLSREVEACDRCCERYRNWESTYTGIRRVTFTLWRHRVGTSSVRTLKREIRRGESYTLNRNFDDFFAERVWLYNKAIRSMICGWVLWKIENRKTTLLENARNRFCNIFVWNSNIIITHGFGDTEQTRVRRVKPDVRA